MSGCNWCENYWDCDGEGGECGGGGFTPVGLEIAAAAGGRPPPKVPPDAPPKVKPPEAGEPVNPPNLIDYTVPLWDEGKGDWVSVEVWAFCPGDQNTTPIVKLNGCPVPPVIQPGGKAPPHNRAWQINCGFDCPQWDVPNVRVQAYSYDGSDNNPPTSGFWPKIWLDQGL